MVYVHKHIVFFIMEIVLMLNATSNVDGEHMLGILGRPNCPSLILHLSTYYSIRELMELEFFNLFEMVLC